jgi:redox-sensitive bicupin YhaK (pirin superfamily)
MGISLLRVINEDKIAVAAGFPTHPHDNMEIVTYVLQGEIAHEDSMGNGGTIAAGEIQRMSAGTGITHSEFNPSPQHKTHLLQIWLLPNKQDIQPSYDQRKFSYKSKANTLKLMLSPDGRDDSMQANTDALIYASVLQQSRQVEHQLTSDRIGYLQVAKGKVLLNAQALSQGGGAYLSAAELITVTATENAEILLFDLPNIQ